MEKPHAFVTLDALRGVAALMVIQVHMAHFFGMQQFGHAYLAVDFFFMLSGFVLTYAYQQRLDLGWSTFSFFKTRAIRLYPLYALSLGIGCLFAISQHFLEADGLPAHVILFLTGMAIFILPIPPSYHAGVPVSFPLNGPSWSLFYEFAANLLHALFLRNRGWRFLLITVLISGSLWACLGVRTGAIGFGADRPYILQGFPRVVFSYALGSLLFRLWKTGWPRLRLPPTILAILLIGVLILPASSRYPVWADLSIVALVFPVLLLISASSQPSTYTMRFARVLGTASYAIYVLHVPLGEFFEQLWKHAFGHRIEAAAPWGGLIYLVLTISLALWIDRVYDLPMRGWLRRKLQAKPAQ